MARYSAEHKQESRERILKAAAKEFRSHGYENATIPGIMQTAGLTVGGFYKHFDSKADLFAETFRAALRKSTDRSQSLREELDDDAWLRVATREYLSAAHRDNVRGGCVIAALASDMPRADDAAKRAFQEEILRSFDAKADAFDSGDPEEARKKAIASQALLLGGLVLARGMADAEVGEEILDACREVATPT